MSNPDDIETRVQRLEAELYVLKRLLRWGVYSHAGAIHVGIEVPCRAGDPISADDTIGPDDPYTVRTLVRP